MISPLVSELSLTSASGRSTPVALTVCVIVRRATRSTVTTTASEELLPKTTASTIATTATRMSAKSHRRRFFGCAIAREGY
jgi:hypothetical protein